LASWRFNSSMELIDSMDHPGIHQEPKKIAIPRQIAGLVR
jgi:hypothetical protein